MTGLCYLHSKVNLKPEQSNCVNSDRIRRSLMVPKTDTHYNIKTILAEIHFHQAHKTNFCSDGFVYPCTMQN